MAPDQIDESFVPRPRSTVATAELDGEAVIYSEETQSMHLLNPTATVVWACFDGSGPLSELIADLSEAFGVEQDVIRRDVLDLAREVGSKGLLEGVAATPPENGDGGHGHDHDHDEHDHDDHDHGGHA
jgi:hypothetical protein